MKCKKAEKLLVPYLEDMLKPKIRYKVEYHLKNCLRCQEIEEYFAKILSLRQEYGADPIPDNLVRSINDKLHEIEPQPNFYPLFKLGYAAMVFCIIILGCNYFLHKTEDLPSMSKNGSLHPGHVNLASPGMEKPQKPLTKNQIKEKVIELAKLPQQIKSADIVFRGAEPAEKKNFSRDWKGISKLIENEGYLIIGTKEDWENIWERLKISAPEVDFNKHVVIGLFSRSEDVEIIQIRETNTRYMMEIKETLPESENRVSYHFVSINKK